MRLGPKSRLLLDTLFALGAAAFTVRSTISGIAHGQQLWDDERTRIRQLRSLQERGWIALDHDRESGEWVVSLTEAGRSFVGGEVDPEAAWSETWDGKWRFMTFDLPQAARSERRMLELWLKERRFGHLQGSVWISHRVYGEWSDDIARRKVDPAAVVFFEGAALGKISNSEMVARAWNFERLNRLYASYLAFIANLPVFTHDSNNPEPQVVVDWLREENQLWQDAQAEDPFLPASLLPAGYLGKKALKLRQRTYVQLNRAPKTGTA